MTGRFESQLATLPYKKGVAEYAVGFRNRMMELEGKDFCVAVDLPHGLEDKIIKAVKKLPRISLIVDDMGRAIPIIPTDAAIEAVRTGLEYGVEVKFLDADLPLPKEKFRGTEEFYHLADRIGIEAYSRLLTPYKSEYQDARENYMALKLRELLENQQKVKEKVLFLSDFKHHQNILNLLESPVDFGCGYLGSTITCKVKESDVWKISPEIPFLMFLYENSRDSFDRQEGFDRQDAILKLYQDDEINLKLIEVYKYARNLAITDGQLYPDLYNLIAAAKYCLDDDYACNVFERSKTYPYSYLDSNCVIKSYIDHDLEPLAGQRILEIKRKLKIGSEYSKQERRNSPGLFIRRFKREEEHFKSEREFAGYLRNNYFYLVPTDDYNLEEFQSGLADGIAVRESVRYQFLDKIYVKNDVMINNTGYVVDFGSRPDTSIYFDSQNYCVGTAQFSGGEDDYLLDCFTMLPNTLKEKITRVMGEISYSDPLNSCTKIALKYSDFVYVFTDHPGNLNSSDLDSKRMKIIPLNRIPKKLKEKMETFKVTYET